MIFDNPDWVAPPSAEAIQQSTVDPLERFRSSSGSKYGFTGNMTDSIESAGAAYFNSPQYKIDYDLAKSKYDSQQSLIGNDPMQLGYRYDDVEPLNPYTFKTESKPGELITYFRDGTNQATKVDDSGYLPDWVAPAIFKVADAAASIAAPPWALASGLAKTGMGTVSDDPGMQLGGLLQMGAGAYGMSNAGYAPPVDSAAQHAAEAAYAVSPEALAQTGITDLPVGEIGSIWGNSPYNPINYIPPVDSAAQHAAEAAWAVDPAIISDMNLPTGEIRSIWGNSPYNPINVPLPLDEFNSGLPLWPEGQAAINAPLPLDEFNSGLSPWPEGIDAINAPLPLDEFDSPFHDPNSSIPWPSGQGAIDYELPLDEFDSPNSNPDISGLLPPPVGGINLPNPKQIVDILKPLIPVIEGLFPPSNPIDPGSAFSGGMGMSGVSSGGGGFEGGGGAGGAGRLGNTAVSPLAEALMTMAIKDRIARYGGRQYYSS